MSLDVAAGDIIALRGANGSGKSTLLRIAAGLLLPDAGSVRIRAVDRPAVGYSSGQERSLYWRLSARQNLEFFGSLYGLPRRTAEGRSRRLLDALELSGKAESRVDSLSSGQRQRLLVARALMGNPAVVLLDEPTGSTDEHASELVWRVLRRHAGTGAAVVLTTHRDADALRADSVLLLDDHELRVTAARLGAGAEGGPSVGAGAPEPPAGRRVFPLLRRRRPRSMPSWIGQMAALFRRDFAVARSYPFGIVAQLWGTAIGSALVFFLSRVVGSGSHVLRPYGSSYLGFAVLGTVAFTVQLFAVGSFSSALRESQLNGTLEALLTAPLPFPTLLLASSLWSLVLALLDVIVLVTVSIGVFGMRFHQPSYALAFLVVLLMLGASVGIGFVEAALVLIYKRNSPFRTAFTYASNVLGGVLYPVSVLPPGVRWLAFLLPLTHAANGLRLSLLTGRYGSALSESGILLAEAAALAVVGLVCARMSLHYARRHGTLGQY